MECSMEPIGSNCLDAVTISDCRSVASAATSDHHLSQYTHSGHNSVNTKTESDKLVPNELTFQWLMSRLTFHGATCFLACLSHIPENFPHRSRYVRKIVNCCHLSIKVHYAKINLISSDTKCMELIRLVKKSTLLNENITFNIQPHLWKAHDYLNENVLSFATPNVSECSIDGCDGELVEGLVSKVIICTLSGPLPSLKSTLECQKCATLYDIDKYTMSDGSVLQYEGPLKTDFTEVAPSTYFTKEVLRFLGQTEYINDCSKSSDVLVNMYKSLVGDSHSWPAYCVPGSSTPEIVLHYPEMISTTQNPVSKQSKISDVGLHYPGMISSKQNPVTGQAKTSDGLHYPEMISSKQNLETRQAKTSDVGLHYPEMILSKQNLVTRQAKTSVIDHKDMKLSGNDTAMDHSCNQLPSNITGDDGDDHSSDRDSGTDTGYYIAEKCISTTNEQSKAQIQHTRNMSAAMQLKHKSVPRNKHECETCGKVFRKNCLLQRHIRTHTKDRPFICELCGHAFGQKCGLDAHLRTHTGFKPFKCAECGKTFAQKTNLNSHMDTHHGERSYQCSTCGKSFGGKRALHLHLQTHTGLRPFKCTLCPKSFVSEWLMKQHIQAHSGIRLYQCSQCGKSFFRRCHLFRHERMHTGLRPHVCKECGKGFTQFTHLQAHLRTHGGDRPFPCHICGKTQQCSHGVHMKSHENDEAQVSSAWNSLVVSVNNDVDADICKA